MGFRRFIGTAAQRAASSQTGSAGDQFFETDTGNFGVADGSTLLKALKRLVRVDEVTTAVQQYVTSLVVTNSLITGLAAESGYVYALFDQNGRVALGVTPSGQVIGKITIANGTLNYAAFDTATTALIPTSMPAESGFVWGVVGSSGRIALGVTPDGTLVVSKLNLPNGSVSLAALTPSLQAQFPGSMYPESGAVWAVADSANREALWVAPDGTVNAAKTGFPVYDLGDIANATYRIHAYRDAAGKYQIRSTRRSDGQIMWDTKANTYNSVNPRLDDANNVLYQTDQSGALSRIYQPAAGGTVWPIMPSLDQTDWGDSLTAGAGQANGIAGSYGGKMSFILSINVTVQGIGGQNTAQIAARQNGVPLTNTASFTIPAGTTPVTVTPSVKLVAPVGDTVTAGSFTGTFLGIPGTLAWDSSNVCTFTRTTAGSSTTVLSGSPFFTDIGVAAQTTTQIIWPGRNDGANFATPSFVTSYLAMVAAMVAYIKPHQKRFLIPSILTGGTAGNEYAGTSIHDNIVAVNNQLASIYQGNYIDIRRYLIDHGLADAGITPTTQDLADVAGDTVPQSLRADAIHLNDYTTVANQFAAQLRARGWYP